MIELNEKNLKEINKGLIFIFDVDKKLITCINKRNNDFYETLGSNHLLNSRHICYELKENKYYIVHQSEINIL